METVFHYKQSAQPRYVLALDKSSPMDERVNFKKIFYFIFQKINFKMILGSLEICEERN